MDAEVFDVPAHPLDSAVARDLALEVRAGFGALDRQALELLAADETIDGAVAEWLRILGAVPACGPPRRIRELVADVSAASGEPALAGNGDSEDGAPDGPQRGTDVATLEKALDAARPTIAQVIREVLRSRVAVTPEGQYWTLVLTVLAAYSAGGTPVDQPFLLAVVILVTLFYADRPRVDSDREVGGERANAPPS